MPSAPSFRVHKVHGLGNDFVLIDAPDALQPFPATRVAAICDRHRGIGADGVLLVLPGEKGVARMRILNADGSLAEMCGNGIRCFARHLDFQRGGTDDILLVDTDAGPKRCFLRRGLGGEVEAVRVAMGAPGMEAADVPLRAGLGETRRHYDVAGRRLEGRALSMGNPHLALFVDELTRELAQRAGAALAAHADFPEGVNVELVVVRDRRTLEVVVYERGVGLTLACGTGACAAAVAACREGRADLAAPLTVHLPGGPTIVEVERGYDEVWLEGPAEEVFAGTFAG